VKKIIVVVEGPTEEKFVKAVLHPHFINTGVKVEAQQWITNPTLGTSGGGQSFDLIENHIRRLMAKYRNNADVFISTMIDLYAFPKQGNTIYDNDVAKLNDGRRKALLLQTKFAERMGGRNFIPYVQLHEFEALLLSKPDVLGVFFTDMQKGITALQNEINGMLPEEINETPDGAPSRRIIKHIPIYKRQKSTAGVVVASAIGLPHLIDTCPHFKDWITRLGNCS
jgi:Domain of unknown function (DUF4276)